MEQKSPVYFRMEYTDAVDSKRELLTSEVSLLNLIKSLKKYILIREGEMKIKAQIYKSVRQLDLTMRKTKSSFPFFKVPSVSEKKTEVKESKMPKERESFDSGIESELREIREKLRAIG